MLCAASVACGCHIALRGLHLQGRLVAWPGLCLSLTDCGPGVLLSQVGAVFGGLQVILCIVYPSRSVDRYAVCGTAHWGVPALICNCSDLLTQPETVWFTSAFLTPPVNVSQSPTCYRITLRHHSCHDNECRMLHVLQGAQVQMQGCGTLTCLCIFLCAQSQSCDSLTRRL